MNEIERTERNERRSDQCTATPHHRLISYIFVNGADFDFFVRFENKV